MLKSNRLINLIRNKIDSKAVTNATMAAKKG